MVTCDQTADQPDHTADQPDHTADQPDHTADQPDHTTNQTDQCFIDVLNIGYFITHPAEKSNVDMPWLLDYQQLEYLVTFTSSPQGILFDLPLFYYVKLVIVVMFNDHHLLLL